MTNNTQASQQVPSGMTDELCEILSTVLHFVPKEESQLSDDIQEVIGKLRAQSATAATEDTQASLFKEVMQGYRGKTEDGKHTFELPHGMIDRINAALSKGIAHD